MAANKLKHERKSRIITNCILSVYTLLTILPLWYVFNNALKKIDYIYLEPYILSAESFTLDNIINAFKVIQYPRMFMNNIIYLVISCGLMIVLGSLAGFGIHISGSKLLNSVYIFIAAGITIPFQLTMIPLVVMMKGMGLYGTYFGVSVVFTVVSLPFVVFLYRGFMKTIPKELFESSIVDGAGILKTYLHIYLPLLKPVTGTVLILRGVFVWNHDLIPMVMISDGKMSTLVLRLYSFVSQQITRWDLVFAGALLVSLPVIILFLFMQRAFISGLTAGSVKG